MAVKEIKGQDDYANSDGDDSSAEEGPTKFLDSSNKFGVKALKASTMAGGPDKEMDAEKVLKAARRVTGHAADNSQSSDSEDDEKPKFAKVDLKKDQKKANKKVNFTTVEFGEDDLAGFNADKSKLIKEKDMEAGEDSKDAE